jgi:hypothetical protein
VNVDALAGLRQMGPGNFLLRNNPQLTSLSGLARANFDGSAVSITRNDSLTSLDGLEGCTDLLTLNVTINPTLASLDGLSGLVAVSGVVTVTKDDALQSVDLPLLEQTGDLTIANNAQLTSCSAPSLLSSGRVSILDNAVLSALSLPALESAASWTVGRNPELPQCLVAELANAAGVAACSCEGNDETASSP